ncbi:UPF0568 C14orf166-like protein [Chlorella sorokiniana]|uniref:UPF0568 C14orf166-like protein n=1 Tax=Chlorella sorokiniana TaxID=3076 RepID=A0A2P6U1N5_CHLSO|nr:UPF0568 C14orf166-like protein [Chlorella sorokiniana]|eukprot:PRW60225.1 UPF0568 C14orf166-like protein [Chlorella sorokiniana]
MLNFLLRSLKYPRLEGFNADDPAHFQAAVVWLENTKVRQYPIDGRAALQSPDPAAWQAALTKYLADLECPLLPEAGNHRAVLQWLASHAVGLEYQDTAQQLTAAAQQAEEEVGPPEEWTEAQLPPLPDVTTDAVRAALAQLQQLLHVEAGKAVGSSSAAAAEATPDGLQKAHAMLETCVLPALAELAKQRQPGSGGAAQQPAAAQGQPGAAAAAASQHAAVAAMLSQYPLGFSTGEAGADLGATILRMLYIKDLRALQTLVDSAIVQVQEYTANPRTDASLGKVGY